MLHLGAQPRAFEQDMPAHSGNMPKAPGGVTSV
jgi:hypothetical protein